MPRKSGTATVRERERQSGTATGRGGTEFRPGTAGAGEEYWIEYRAIDEIKPQERNPKQHNLAELELSHRRFGLVRPLMIDEGTGKLIFGHGNLERLQRAFQGGEEPPEGVLVRDGRWFVPVVRGKKFDNESEALAYLVADNRQGEIGGWDDELLARVIADIQQETSTLAGLGYSDAELDDLVSRVIADLGSEPSTEPRPSGSGEEAEADFWLQERSEGKESKAHFRVSCLWQDRHVVQEKLERIGAGFNGYGVIPEW
jgi:ParB-like chromosome segregation protein Spo0J